MPPTQRRQPVAVIARLLAEPHRFGFFQAVRLLDRWLATEVGGQRAETPAGRIRFRNSLAMGFPASEIAGLDVVAKRDPAAPGTDTATEGAVAMDAASAPPHPQPAEVESIEMTPAFMGFLGTGSALPMRYTEVLAERETYHRDTAARAFLDIFQHRAVSLFYQAWRKHRLPVQFESDTARHFKPHVLALAGLGQSALRDRLRPQAGGLADDTLAYFAGVLQQRPVSAGTVRQMVSGYFGVRVRLEPFVGRWFTLPAGSETSLGLAQAGLGTSAIVGSRVWQRDLRMRLTLGPMPRAQFRRFLPGGAGEVALRELLTLLTGVSLEYEIRLALRAEDVEGMRLTGNETPHSPEPAGNPSTDPVTATPAAGVGALLGWDTFLVTQPALQDRDDAGYDLHALA